MSYMPTIVGEFRAGSDATLKFSAAGTPYSSFSVIASTSKRREDGTWETTAETPWFRVKAFGPLAEQCANDVTKGVRVYVAGRGPQSDKWATAEGEDRETLVIMADAVAVIPDRSKPAVATSEGGAGQPSGGGDPWPTATQTDEPPF